MFELIEKMIIRLSTSLVNGSNHTKCVSMSNQKCMIQPTLTNLHLNEHSQKLHCYSFAVSLHRCLGSCNILMTCLIKYVFQTNRRFKSKCVHHDYRNK